MNLDKGLKFICYLRRVFEWVNRTSGTLSGVICIMMIITIIPDVITRRFFSAPIKGVYEIDRLLMVALVFFAIAWAQSEHAHPRVTAVVERLPGKARAIADITALLLSLGIVLLIAIEGVGPAYTAVITGESEWAGWRIPIWPGKIVIVFGLFLLAIQLVVDIVDVFKKQYSSG